MAPLAPDVGTGRDRTRGIVLCAFTRWVGGKEEQSGGEVDRFNVTHDIAGHTSTVHRSWET
jgi:hypothetical protein